MKYARTETERRFLLGRPPEDLPAAYRRIRDWYLDGTRMRLRRIEDPRGAVVQLKLGQKYGAGLSTAMTNIYLNPAEYELLRTLGGRPIVKRRYAYACDGRIYSVDVFESQLAGLVLAEIEFADAHAADRLPLPAFALADVTEVPFFTGGALADATAEQLARELARRGCAPAE